MTGADEVKAIMRELEAAPPPVLPRPDPVEWWWRLLRWAARNPFVFFVVLLVVLIVVFYVACG